MKQRMLVMEFEEFEPKKIRDNIVYLLSVKRETITRMSEVTGISLSTINNWKFYMPSCDKLYRCSKFLGRSMEEIMTGKKTLVTSNDPDATLGKLFESLSDENRETITRLIIALSEKEKK